MLRVASRSLLRGSTARLRWLCSQPQLDPVTPSPDRALKAVRRERLGKGAAIELREHARVPASLAGDRLPFEHLSVDLKELEPFLKRSHYQRELLTVDVDGGETVRALIQEVQYNNFKEFIPRHINFRRWPRDPIKNPVKLSVPLVFINEDSVQGVKTGGSYVFDMFAGSGIPCLVRDAQHVPRFFLADMRKSVDGDLFREHIDIPPGVTVRPNARTMQNDGNFLIGRVKRVRG